jgi:hypothetical protein
MAGKGSSTLSKREIALRARRSNPPRFVDIEDFDEPMNILCHGDTGAGKSRLWGHLPRLVIIACEQGAVAIKKAGIKGVKVIPCHSWPDIVGAYEWLRDHPNEYEWCMFDSITKAQSMCIRHIMEMVVLANAERDPHIPAQGDHFKWQLSIKGLVEDFNELPINMVWLARSMVKENPDGDEIIVPSIEGKDYGISAWVCGEMSLLCYLRKERVGKGESSRVVRKLYTNEHDKYWCKDWYDALPHVIQFESEAGVATKIVDMLRDSGNSPAEAKKKAATTRPVKKAATRKKVASRG